LLGERNVSSGQQLELQPWGIAILEEDATRRGGSAD
jgi:hypothetical protein